MSMFEEYERDPARTLDRLVDGELSPRDRRELLALLDDEPGGWRRCALAYVEAQSWRSDLGRLANEPLARPVQPVVTASPSPQPERWGTRFALAACLLLAFVLGRQFTGDGWLMNTFLPTGTVTQSLGRPANLRQQVVPTPSPSPGNWQVVTLVPLEGDPGEPIQLVVDTSTAEENRATPQNPATSAMAGALSQPFEREGWDVQRVERFVPIELSDGRRLVVPIEELDIRRPDVVQF